MACSFEDLDRDTTALRQPSAGHDPSDPIGSIGSNARAVLAAQECLALAPRLLRRAGHRLRAFWRWRSAWISRTPTVNNAAAGSSRLQALAEDADVAARDLLTPALRDRSRRRAYSWAGHRRT